MCGFFAGDSDRALQANDALDPGPLLRYSELVCSLPLYCTVTVNATFGCPSPYGPSAVTCNAPAFAGNVSTTAAFPDEFVVTVRFESVPADAVNSTSAPAALPPDEPGFRVTDKFTFVPGAPDCPSPCFVSVAARFPTTIHPLCSCVAPALSVPGTV